MTAVDTEHRAQPYGLDLRCAECAWPWPCPDARRLEVEGLRAKVDAVAQLAATLEAEANYHYQRDPHVVDVGVVAHRIRHALGLV